MNMNVQFCSELNNLPLRYYSQLSNFCTGGSGYRTCLHSLAGIPTGLLAITVGSETQFIIRPFISDRYYRHGYHRSLNAQNWSQTSTLRLYGNNANKEKARSQSCLRFFAQRLRSHVLITQLKWKVFQFILISIFCQIDCFFNTATWQQSYACIQRKKQQRNLCQFSCVLTQLIMARVMSTSLSIMDHMFFCILYFVILSAVRSNGVVSSFVLDNPYNQHNSRSITCEFEVGKQDLHKDPVHSSPVLLVIRSFNLFILSDLLQALHNNNNNNNNITMTTTTTTCTI